MNGDTTSGNVRGDPERLEAYSEEMEFTIPVARAAIEDYEGAIRAFNAAPNDLGVTLEDLGPSLHAELDALRELDRGPAAFAFALRNLDQLTFGDRPAEWLRWATVTDLEWFNALAQARLNMPDATDAEVIAAAQALLDTSWDWPWEKKGVGGWIGERLTPPFWWAGTAIESATATVIEVDKRLVERVSGYYRRTGRWVDPYARWHRGTADFMNRISRAATWAKLAPWARRAGLVAAPLVPASEQVLKDLDDASLTTGDRIARTGAAAALDGGGSFVGGWAGAQAGAVGGAALGGVIGSVVPGAGTVVGAAVGGTVGAIGGTVVGAWVGGEAGQMIRENIGGAIDWSGDRIDEALEWGDDMIDGALDFGGDIARGVGSVF